MKSTTRIYWMFALLLTAGLLMTGCTAPMHGQPADAATVAASPGARSDYILQPGDELEIKFFYNPELNESVTVRPDGKISLQLIDDVQAAGMKPTELDEVITREYSVELQQPKVTVIVRSFNTQKIYVGGEVNQQGIIDYSAGLTALQAVYVAQGFLDTAQPSETIVIRKGPDNRPLPVRVDLRNIFAQNDGAAFPLQPQDIVYVPKSPIAEANKFVNQYVEQLLLFRGFNVGLGYSYELHSEDGN